MRDFTDDLAALRGASTRPRAICASTSCAAPGRSSRPRCRGPTSGTTRSGPQGDTVSWPRWAKTSALYDSLARRIDDAETLLRARARRGRRLGRARGRGRDRRGRGPRSTSSSCARCSPASTTTADAICEIQSGSGGADAQDWAEMLLRMDLRWAERRGFDVELDEVSPGSEAGISSADLHRPRPPRLRAAPVRARGAPTRAHLPVQRPGQAADRVRGARGVPRSSRTCPTSRSTRRTCASTPTGRRAPVVSTST